MTRRTPEQIDRVVDGINKMLPCMGDSSGAELVQSAIDGSVLSNELRTGIRKVITRARYQGIVDGIRYAAGEGELPDIERALSIGDIMAKYISPAVIKAVLGPIDPAEEVSC